MLAWILNLGFAASPPGLVTVPDVTGETQAQATTDITALGLTVSVSSAYSDTVAAGIVISQIPVGGTSVDPASNVAITVSLGPQPITQDTHDGFPKRKPREYPQTQIIRESDLKKALSPKKIAKRASTQTKPPLRSSDEPLLLLAISQADDEVLGLAEIAVTLLKTLH